MKYSDQLNGYWEEGYHYYVEIRDNELVVRDYQRKVCLRTRISYDDSLLESGTRTVIALEDNVLSRDASGNPFTVIRELAYENGEMRFLDVSAITEETLYTLKKVDHDPFSHIIIRDDEYMDALQGEWIEWRQNGNGSVLTIAGDKLTWRWWSGAEAYPFHVVSYTYAPGKVQIVPADLTERSFPGFQPIVVLPDKLTTYMNIYDGNTTVTIFARAEMLDKINVPGEAKPAPCIPMTMTPSISTNTLPNWLNGTVGAGQPMPATEQKKEGPSFCPNCGYKLGIAGCNYCPDCGYKL